MSIDGVDDRIDLRRRRLLTAAATVVGGAGVAAVAVPFVSSMQPSARAQAAGAPVEVDIGKLEPGQRLIVEWRGNPVWVVYRSDEAMAGLNSARARLRDPDSAVATQQPAYARNEHRSIRPEILVVVGICTHLGCSPTYRPEIAPADLGADWRGGFFCPCHGSLFDMAGRVYAGVPAPTNLVVPPHNYISDNRLLIGEDQGAA
jgi:ubiquinol-cytochrome c reductase iron-sulfur subunit